MKSKKKGKMKIAIGRYHQRNETTHDFFSVFFFVLKIALTCGRNFGSIKMLEMTRNETALNCVTVAKTVLASFLSRLDHVAPKH